MPKTLLPLAPSSRGPDSASDSASESRSAARADEQPAPRAGHTKKNASVACDQCRLAKRKCDQLSPCSNCRNNQRECTYNPSSDGRRKDARKRRLEDLEYQSNALGRLLSKIRTSTKTEAHELVDLIREDASLEDILAFINAHPGELADEVRRSLSASPAPPPAGTSFRKVLAINDLIDNPTVQVPAAPWTTVTSDDGFVSNLMSAYLNWYHYYYHNFDWHLFINACQAKDVDSLYCSPFLVNAVLAMGCFFTDHPAALAVPGDQATRGLHFYEEADRLYKAEQDRVSLTNVQGSSIMMLVVSLAGKDKAIDPALRGLQDLVRQVHELHGMRDPISSAELDLQRSLRITEWGAYVYHCGFSMGFGLGYTWGKPSVERPYADEKYSSLVTEWSSYPLNREPIPLRQHALYESLLDVYGFMEETIRLLQITFPTLTPVEKIDAVQAVDDRIVDWYALLPAEHRFDQDSFIVTPATVDLHTTLYFIRLSLWSQAMPVPTESTSSAAEADPLETQQENEPTQQSAATLLPEQDKRGQIVAKCLSIVKLYADVMARFEERFGTKFFTLLTPQPGIFSASFLLTGHLYTSHEEELLLRIMRVLVHVATRNTLVKGVTQMLLKLAEEKVKAQTAQSSALTDKEAQDNAVGQVSPKMFESMEMIVKELQWAPSDHLHFSSRYPNYIADKRDDAGQLSDLLEKWASLAIDEMEAEDPSGKDLMEPEELSTHEQHEIDEAPPLPSIEKDDD
ncbi:hypothetical protein PV10_08695 [Exophiala mesophila]|uniref:Zn(2)-C6 fungal-type domain-containing protein n=2 Tax=Exophiala mesophila TaxID=212818 RepID=A0A0D1Z5C2_EXOME|nr:uncharacterized protein PV10_08695 [Exophiala mesophila]KIV89089.1 hypothetical protein PV10_08695 [Exophiala mesophila]